MEKWVKALHSEPRLPVTLGSNTVIKIGLLTLPFDSGPKLAVGQWIAWWSGLPGWSSSRGKLFVLCLFVFCLIIVVIFIGGEVGGSWFLKKPCKDFNLAVAGGLGWMKWLKNGAGKCLYFMQLLLHYILFGEILLVKVPLFSVCFNLSHKKKK